MHPSSPEVPKGRKGVKLPARSGQQGIAASRNQRRIARIAESDARVCRIASIAVNSLPLAREGRRSTEGIIQATKGA